MQSMASAFLSKLPALCNYNKINISIRQTEKSQRTRSFFSGKRCSCNNENSTKGNVATVNVPIGDSGQMVITTGKYAKLADGSATVTFQNTTVMAAVVSKEKSKSPSSFVPLTVSYQQKAAALGRIPLNFLRREIGQNEHEILTSRMIDRSLRPLFPEGFNWETQIICNPLAIDGSNFPDILAINAASAALTVSDVPWDGPVGAVRVGFIDEKPVVNPTKEELKRSQLNLVMAARESKIIVMLDGSASNILLNYLMKCLKEGAKECQKIVSGMVSLRKQVGKTKRNFERSIPSPELETAVEKFSVDKLREIFRNHSHDKLSRDEAISSVYKEVVEIVSKDFPEESALGSEVFWKICKNAYKDLVFETGIRCDGRKLDELRDILCEVDLYEPLHGSALFQRGQTQVLCTVALDSPNSALKTDKIQMLTSGLKEKNFFVHYEFPPFATKETGRLGPIGRREIGHGILAEKALKGNIPDNYPFTIRLTSEVLESNGSSSMATVCGGTLALLDAGVPMDSPCAGVAMGFLSKLNENNEIADYRILTDILGFEDFFGEMDFKIAGTKKAYTACQLDVKNSGIPIAILLEILVSAKNSIERILQIMQRTCPTVRLEKKAKSPALHSVAVPFHLRSKFLGPGGVNLRKMETSIGVEVSEGEPGEFTVFAPNEDAMKEAKEMIEELLKQPEELSLEFGGVYSATITEIRESGCMVTLYPNMKPVHIHVSQLDLRKVSHPSALGLEVGQTINVKYFGRDPVSGTMRLSRKVLLDVASEVVQSLRRKPWKPSGEKEKEGEGEGEESLEEKKATGRES